MNTAKTQQQPGLIFTSVFTFAYAAACIAALSFSVNASADISSLEEALTNGTPSANFRLRFEQVDRDGFDESTALTLRSRLGYKTKEWNGFQAFGGEAYASTPGEIGENRRFIIADPTGDELNQIWLKYSYGDHSITYGRQRLVVNNARVIGNVGWRQNEQTFDALNIVTKVIPNTELQIAQLNKSHFIFFNTLEIDNSYLVNAKWNLGKTGKLAAYGFWLNFDDGDSANDTKTFGLRYTAAYGGETQFLLTAELAQQSDYSDYTKAANDDDFSATYANLELGIKNGGFTGKIGYELLGSDNGDEAVTFPLATGHKFNGWVDIFLTTPDTGLEDSYLMLAGTFNDLTMKLFYHDYTSDEGSIDYGSEVNFVLVKPVSDRLSLTAKAGFYDADELGADTDRFWLQADYAF